MEILTFDIETIPQSNLSDIQEAELERKLNKFTSSDKDEYDGIRRRIMATSPYWGEIICIGVMKVTDSGEYDTIAITGDEKKILEKWWSIIKGHKGLFVHYNGLGFDVPFIIKRSLKHRVEPTNHNFLDTRRFQKYPHYDVQQLLADYDRYQTASLHLACDFVGIDSPKEGDIKAENVEQAYKDGRIEEISEYCLRDVVQTHRIYSLLDSYTFKPRR